MVITSVAQSKSNPFSITPLLFSEIAEAMNTHDKKGMPMEFINGISFSLGGQLEAPYPIMVSVVLNDNVNIKALELLRWDGSLRKWMPFSGNTFTREIHTAGELINFSVIKEGKYGLFYGNKSNTTVQIQLPKKHECVEYRYVQHNTALVYESKGKGQLVTIPIAQPSPRAELVMKCKDEQRKAYTLNNFFGALCSSDGKDYVDESFFYQLRSKDILAFQTNK